MLLKILYPIGQLASFFATCILLYLSLILTGESAHQFIIFATSATVVITAEILYVTYIKVQSKRRTIMLSILFGMLYSIVFYIWTCYGIWYNVLTPAHIKAILFGLPTFVIAVICWQFAIRKSLFY